MKSDLSFCVDSFFSCSFNNLFMERIVKFSNHFVSFEISRGNFIEFLLYTCGESVVHNVFKILIQKVSYNHSNVAWKHFFLFCSGGLLSFISGDLSILEGKFKIFPFGSWSIFKEDITSFENSRDGRSIG